MTQNTQNLAAYIWSLADLLRGDFKQSQYGRIILPFTLLRRLECVLEPTKETVLTEVDGIKARYPETAWKPMLEKITGVGFFNTSRMDLSKLGESDIKANLESYILAFSKDAREIFEHFKFAEFIGRLADANLLYKIVQRVRTTDLSMEAVSNHDMGLVFEELIRRFAESSNETAGEHFTPRDIVRLTTSLVFIEDDQVLRDPGIIRTIYDPTAGTGGFLSAGMEYVAEMNEGAVVRAFGQELNPESYAICKGDMMIKGQEVDRIKLGNTLSGDQLYGQQFDYMLSNPPFGVDWKKIEKEIKDEHAIKGFDGRFGPGLPRVSDGSLLFLMHLISKLRPVHEGGSRIGIILNGSPLFTGGAGSGESEIRRTILETDLLEAIVALPTDMFYNTGISTYVWILSNKKSEARKGKVQLINGVNLFGKMRKSLGSKRNEMGEADIKAITRCFGHFEAIEDQVDDKAYASKIFPSHAFGFRRITVERPLRESFQFSDERLDALRFAPKPLDEPMKWIESEFLSEDSASGLRSALGSPSCTRHSLPSDIAETLKQYRDAIRSHLKTHFSKLKPKQVKMLLDAKTWQAQAELWAKAKRLQAVIGEDPHDDMNAYDGLLKRACKTAGVSLESADKKQIVNAVSWKNPEAAKVIAKTHRGAKPNPLYGMFEANGTVVSYKADSELRDAENIPLDPSHSVKETVEAYFLKEVAPHVEDAWIDDGKRDAKDGELGIVGYEIPFNRHFYVYQPPRDLAEIDADLDKVSAEIMQLLREVHS